MPDPRPLTITIDGGVTRTVQPYSWLWIMLHLATMNDHPLRLGDLLWDPIEHGEHRLELVAAADYLGSERGLMLRKVEIG